MDILIVLIAGFVSFAIGGLWFSPVVFYEKYAKILNRSEADVKETMDNFKAYISFPITLLGEITIAFLIYYLTYLNNSINDIFIVLIIAVIVCLNNIKTNIFSYNNLTLYLIINGQMFISIMVMGTIITLFT
jgi:hypothetical protein